MNTPNPFPDEPRSPQGAKQIASLPPEQQQPLAEPAQSDDDVEVDDEALRLLVAHKLLPEDLSYVHEMLKTSKRWRVKLRELLNESAPR